LVAVGQARREQQAKASLEAKVVGIPQMAAAEAEATAVLVKNRQETLAVMEAQAFLLG
tara:strand:- start:313 stop:486 length:174 start_codon:yes stop_codon:yes gene_type:complete